MSGAASSSCWRRGIKQAQAGRLLRRDASTISREVRRGATRCGYRAQVAQDAADAARARPKPRKLESNPVLLVEVVQRLEKRHSPEQIAGRLREDFPDDPEMWVSHESIYQAMYVQPRGSSPGWSRPRCGPDEHNENIRAARQPRLVAGSKT